LLLLACGALDGFSPIAGLVDAVADPVWLLVIPEALGEEGGAGGVALAEGVELLWVAVMPAASPDEELGVAELDEGVVPELAVALLV
jgi:hypothetical protein